MLHWCVLFAAIVAEVSGTTLLALLRESHPLAGHGLMAVCVALSFYLLSVAMRRVPMGVAYAVWEGVGLLLLASLSALLLAEPIGAAKACGFVLILAGVWLLKGGHGVAPDPEPGAAG